MSFWDVLLVWVAVSHATVLAYTYDPRWKAVLLGLPTVFTIGVLAVGQPVGATNVLGLALLMFFGHAVRLLHTRLGLNIIASLAVSAFGYCAAGTALNRVVPRCNTAFWASVAFVLVLATALYLVVPHKREPGYRTPLPLWIKAPAIAAVVCGLLGLKSALQGFMTMFPMVSVPAFYEGRHSLQTMARQMSVVTFTLAPMMVACRLTQGSLGLGRALIAGWAVFLLVFLPLTRPVWSRKPGNGPE